MSIQQCWNKIGRAITSISFKLALVMTMLLGISGLYQIVCQSAEANSLYLAQVTYSRTDLDEYPNVNPADSSDNFIDNAREQLKETADTVREKLNLDEPIPDSTKEFIEDVKETIAHPFDTGKDVNGKDLSDRQADRYYHTP